MTYQPPNDPYRNPYTPPGQYPPPNPTAPMPGQSSGWPDPYQSPDPYGQPPISGQPFSQQPAGPGGPMGPGGPGMPPPPGGYPPPGGPQPSGGGNGAMIAVIIGVVVVLILAVGIGGYLFISSNSDSADDGDSSSSSSQSSSSSSSSSPPPTTTTEVPGGDAATAQKGDCLDYPTDPNDTKIVECGGSDAHFEVKKRVDEPSTNENTQEAAAKECEGEDYDTTLYVLGSTAPDPFVLCLKTL